VPRAGGHYALLGEAYVCRRDSPSEQSRPTTQQQGQDVDRVSAAAGVASITVGLLGDGTDPGVSRLAAAYRQNHPGIDIRIRDTDLTDPTCGLRAGLVDVALTRAPFDETTLTVRTLRTDPVGAVLRADDPLARRDRLRLTELSDRR
jgi:DNA-binding transcriptional LysR family regulator